jgi:2-hydroxy-6-oxonona-2,4-dienedioate hydrolase
MGGAAVLLAPIVIAYPFYLADMRAARERISSGSTVAQTRCGRIEYAEAGSGPAVLLVHGAGGGFDQSMMVAGEELARSARVIAVSRFGYLRTPLPADASPAAQADAYACLLDTLKIDRAAVFAASAGSPSAMQFALRHPERTHGLALLVPLAYMPDAPIPAPPAAARLLFSSDFVFWALAKVISRFGPAASDAEERRFRAMVQQPLPISARLDGLRNDGAVAHTLERYELERIRVPTLVISVRDDGFGMYERASYTAANVPGARLVTYEKGGHFWVGHHAPLLAELKAFLERHTRTPSASTSNERSGSAIVQTSGHRSMRTVARAASSARIFSASAGELR